MIRNISIAAGFLAVVFLSACGTPSSGPEGSMHQEHTGVNGYGYPSGQPKDAESPALASSTEQQYSRDQKEKD